MTFLAIGRPVDRRTLPESVRILNLTHRLWDVDVHLVSREILRASVETVVSSGVHAIIDAALVCEMWRQAVSSSYCNE